MDKAELLNMIQTSHRQLERYLFFFEKNEDGVFVASSRPKFGSDEMTMSGVVGEWSLRDLLAHLTEWERRFMSWYQAGRQGKEPVAPPVDMAWEEMDTSDYFIQGAGTIATVLVEFRDVYREIFAAVAAIPADELFTPGQYGWTGNATLADYVALTTYSHYTWAKQYIRRWRKSHAGQYLNKQVILERIETERRRLEENLTNLTEEELVTAGVVGDWSVKDLLAHLFDWEQRFLGWYEAGRRGEAPKTPAPGIGWNELDRLNQQIYENYRHWALADVLAAFAESYQQILTIIRAMPEAEMFTVGQYTWLGNGNLVSYILANTANHYRWAKQQIRRWLKGQ